MGDPEAARLRIREVEGIRLLSFNDIPHIAFSVAFERDYPLTWNCAHIANGHTIKRPVAINQRLGRPTPVIVTPEELLEEQAHGPRSGRRGSAPHP